MQEMQAFPWVGKIPWRRKWQPSTVFRRRRWHPTPVLLPGKSHGWRSLVGCSPWGRWGLDMTEWLYFHFSLSCIGEGNGNPLQCSYLENPRDRVAWWAAVYGVTQSWTRQKRLSSSSSRTYLLYIIKHLYSLTNTSHFPLAQPFQPPFCFVSEFEYLRFLIYMLQCSICSSGSGLVHLAQCPPSSSILLQISIFTSFLKAE